MSKQSLKRFCTDIREVIDLYGEAGMLTMGEAVGGLEILKVDLIRDSLKAEEGAVKDPI